MRKKSCLLKTSKGTENLTSENRSMSALPLDSTYSLNQAVEELAETTVSLGVIPGFVVRYCGDRRDFYLPGDRETEPLTAEQAYHRLKTLVEQSGVLTEENH